MHRATAYDVGPEFIGQGLLIGVGFLVLVVIALLLSAKKMEANEQRKREQQRAEVERASAERTARVAAIQEEERRQRALDRQWPEDVLDHYLEWLLTSSNRSTNGLEFRSLRGVRLTDREIDDARRQAQHQGLAVYDGRRWRLTNRGRRIFEEYAGDRQRMNEAEKKRHQPSVRIDARGAGTVAHTIEGGVHGTTVNNMSPGAPMPKEVDLQAVLALLDQLRRALPAAEGLSDLARDRAAGDLGEVDRELRAPEEDREPGRVRAALERLRTTFVGVSGLVEVVNQLWDHLRVWFPAG